MDNVEKNPITEFAKIDLEILISYFHSRKDLRNTIMFILILISDKKSNQCHITVADLADLTGFQKRSIQNSIKDLAGTGFIDRPIKNGPIRINTKLSNKHPFLIEKFDNILTKNIEKKEIVDKIREYKMKGQTTARRRYTKDDFIDYLQKDNEYLKRKDLNNQALIEQMLGIFKLENKERYNEFKEKANHLTVVK